MSILSIYIYLYLSISIYLGIVDKCDINGTVCGGSPIVYNTSDQNYLYSLNVQYDWVCEKVYLTFLSFYYSIAITLFAIAETLIVLPKRL